MFSLLPKWRLRGRGDRGEGLSARCARFRKFSHSVLCCSAALTPLGHDIHSIRSTSARHPHPPCPQNLVETKAAQAAGARSARPCETAGKRPRGRAACGESPPPDSRPQGRHFRASPLIRLLSMNQPSPHVRNGKGNLMWEISGSVFEFNKTDMEP